MTTLLERLRKWNERMNGLPRKAGLVAATLLVTWLFVLAVPLCWPFILAALFSMILMPLVRLCKRGTSRLHIPCWLITLVAMILLFGVLGVGLSLLVHRLLRELASLARSAPSFVGWLSDTALPYLRGVYQQYSDVLPASIIDVINRSLSSLGDSAVKAAGSLSAALTSGAVNAATSIPGILLSIVLTIMGTFYMTVDHDRILDFFRRTFPKSVQRHSILLKNNLFRSLFGQIKSQLTVSLIIMIFLVVAFTLYGVKYGLLFGVLIGAADALPVIGAGLFLIPWSLVEFVLGNVSDGIFFAAAYIGTVLIRQVFEPRIVGANLGLYPLATMIAMFAGFQIMGVLGLIVGPILLNILKVVLEADDAARGIRWEPMRPRNVKKPLLRRQPKPPPDTEETKAKEDREEQE